MSLLKEICEVISALLKYTVISKVKNTKIMEKSATSKVFPLMVFVFFIGSTYFLYTKNKEAEQKDSDSVPHFVQEMGKDIQAQTTAPVLDTVLYDKKMEALANNPPLTTSTSIATTSKAETTVTGTTEKLLWPVKAVYPNYGALLPFNRIVAYYGNFYSKKMGALGEYPEDVMIEMLLGEVKKWEVADPSTPVIPAIHYIASTAQPSPGRDNKYMLQMPFSEIDKSIALAEKVKGIVFLDLQIGHSDVITEVKEIEKYLALPQVHLGIDPEFAMKDGSRPGTRIGKVDAKEINDVAELLAKIVRDNNLPPKILVIHRFTEEMVTNYKDIRPLPEVQIVIQMDGWGSPELKKATYEHIIYDEPVQFSGFKLFYKNDIRMLGSRLITPEEILKLRPIPSYIQYQ
jgi:hypothetical protein